MNIRKEQPFNQPHPCLDVAGVAGLIRAVYIPKGQTSPNFPEKAISDSLVEFYDLRYAHTPDGQFTGGRYYVKTLLASDSEFHGLNLNGGVEAWKIDADAYQLVKSWLQTLESGGV
jgi:hypothetical protein